ncbi:MAG: response regulator [Deltaproteobacteria bacterium]|nr:response regulator [Deltaproteobacteria bacterium]
MSERHHLLRRQIARLIRDEPVSPTFVQFLDAVDRTYHQSDEDRRLLERSLELMSEEMLEQNAALSRSLIAEKEVHTRTVRLHDALTHLATILAEGNDLVTSMTRICGVVVEALDVERASVWRLDDDTTSMQCLTMFARSGHPPLDSNVVAIDCHPAYLTALRTARVVAVDIDSQPELAAVGPVSLIDITAGLMVPCRIAGQPVGVVHIAVIAGPRDWTAEEKLFAASVADCVSLALESERRRREEDLRIGLEADLRQRQRMDSIGMLAGGIAHDFNNLLVPILGNAEMVLESIEPNHPDRDLIDEIRQAGMSARDLVGQLLAFSRKQVLQLRTVDIADEARTVARLLIRALPEHVELQLDLVGALSVRADPGQLQQVILNLVVNAKDAMPAGGTIRMIGRRVELPGPHISLVIEDTGTGMDEATLAKVFEPFFTTKELGRGTGLGLSTAYGIVEQHGGTLTATSQLGRGTRFELMLPCAVAASAAQPERAKRPKPGQQESILLVEDEPMVLGVSKRLLVSAGFRVIAAGGPEEAIALASKHPEIELVVTDVMMPGMNGVQMFDEISKLLPGAGVLYMSGYDNEVLAPQGVLADGVDLVRKPFSSADLIGAIARRLEAGRRKS